MEKQQSDYENALIDPTLVYERPSEVLKDKRWSNEQKLTILRHWEADAREMEVAEEEGMIGGDPDQLYEILEAIATIPDSSSVDMPDAPTKQG